MMNQKGSGSGLFKGIIPAIPGGTNESYKTPNQDIRPRGPDLNLEPPVGNEANHSNVTLIEDLADLSWRKFIVNEVITIVVFKVVRNVLKTQNN